MNEITRSTRRPTDTPPALQTPRMHTAISVFLNQVETTIAGRNSISSLCAPSPDERRILAERQAVLRSSIRPADAADIADMILAMFDAWPTVRMDAQKARGVAVTYGDHVAHLPLWAIEGGVRVCQGKATPFPPSAGEFKAACEARVVPTQLEMTDLTKILNAVVYTPRTGDRRIPDAAREIMADLGCKTFADAKRDA